MNQSKITSTGFLFDTSFLDHDNPIHPENATRLIVVLEYLQELNWFQELTTINTRPALAEELARIHSETYINSLNSMCESGDNYLDPDTYLNIQSFLVARMAAGSCIELVTEIAKGNIKNGMALCRPPGHHAERDKGMGFCLLNNIAIAAEALIQTEPINRIAIIDYDAHHGNGIQQAFYKRSDVLYISSHAYPFFPGSGNMVENGTSDGQGYNINICLPPGSGHSTALQFFQKIVIPAVERYQPDMIIVAAGYDAYWNDPMAPLNWNLDTFLQIDRQLFDLAEKNCRGKLAYILEGGYDRHSLPVAISNSLSVLASKPANKDPFGAAPGSSSEVSDAYINAFRKFHKVC